jgi:hypothetical protein
MRLLREYLISDKGVSVPGEEKKFRQYAPTPLSDIIKYIKKIIRKKLVALLRVRKVGQNGLGISDNFRQIPTWKTTSIAKIQEQFAISLSEIVGNYFGARRSWTQ